MLNLIYYIAISMGTYKIINKIVAEKISNINEWLILIYYIIILLIYDWV